MDKLYDVIIVGAGPGGSSAAYFLAQAGLDVLLLDKADFPRDKTCGDGLTPRALSVLEEMDVLGRVQPVAHRINRLEIFGRMGNSVNMTFPPHSVYPGYMLISPRLKLDEVLLNWAVEHGAEFQGMSRVLDVEDRDGHTAVRVRVKNREQTYKARFVILAVGANFGMLRAMGVLKRMPRQILGARAYYENVQGLSDAIQAHFQDVPLPGYGWVFPLSGTAANIGIGYWKSGQFWRSPPVSPAQAMHHWLSTSPRMKDMLADAEPLGKVQGYPLRVDFAKSPTTHGRSLLVGEAAGLVSPLTGEGIDFALESGMLAAYFLADVFESGEVESADLRDYDALLRAYFQRLYRFLGFIRGFYINPFLMNRAILAARKYPDVKETMVRVLMSETDASDLLSLGVIRKVIFGV